MSERLDRIREHLAHASRKPGLSLHVYLAAGTGVDLPPLPSAFRPRPEKEPNPEKVARAEAKRARKAQRNADLRERAGGSDV